MRGRRLPPPTHICVRVSRGPAQRLGWPPPQQFENHEMKPEGGKILGSGSGIHLVTLWVERFGEIITKKKKTGKTLHQNAEISKTKRPAQKKTARAGVVVVCSIGMHRAPIKKTKKSAIHAMGHKPLPRAEPSCTYGTAVGYGAMGGQSEGRTSQEGLWKRKGDGGRTLVEHVQKKNRKSQELKQLGSTRRSEWYEVQCCPKCIPSGGGHLTTSTYDGGRLNLWKEKSKKITILEVVRWKFSHRGQVRRPHLAQRSSK